MKFFQSVKRAASAGVQYCKRAVVTTTVVVGSLMAPVLSHAQATTVPSVDTSASVSAISSITTNVLAIGAAVFAVAVTIKLYKWLRQAL